MSHTVLIVDDSRLARMVAANALAKIRPEWTALEASDADQALSMLSAQPIDIALIDFNMPGIDGLALAARFREARPEMPIALVSANLQEEVVARARQVAATFIPKPVTEEGLKGFMSGAALRLRGQSGG